MARVRLMGVMHLRRGGECLHCVDGSRTSIDGRVSDLYILVQLDTSSVQWPGG